MADTIAISANELNGKPAAPALAASPTELSLTTALETMKKDGALQPGLTDALITALQNDNQESATRLYDDLFGGSPDSQKRLFQLTQMSLSGADNSFSSIATPNASQAKAQEERAQRRAADYLWQQLTLNQRIQTLQKDIEQTKRQIAEANARKAGLEISIEGHNRNIRIIDHKIDELKTRNYNIENFDIPQTKMAMEAHARNLERAIVNGGLDAQSYQALRNTRSLARELVTIGHALPGDNNHPPRRHVVYQDAQGGFYVEDQNGGRHAITDERALRRIEMQLENGEKLGNHADPDIEAKVRRYESEYTRYLEGQKNLSPDVRQRIMHYVQEFEETEVKLNDKLKEIEENNRRIGQLQQERADLIRSRNADQAKLRQTENEIKQLSDKLKTQQADLHDLMKQSNDYSTRLNELSTFMESEDFKIARQQVLDGTITERQFYEIMDKKAPDAFKQELQELARIRERGERHGAHHSHAGESAAVAELHRAMEEVSQDAANKGQALPEDAKTEAQHGNLDEAAALEEEEKKNGGVPEIGEVHTSNKRALGQAFAAATAAGGAAIGAQHPAPAQGGHTPTSRIETLSHFTSPGVSAGLGVYDLAQQFGKDGTYWKDQENVKTRLTSNIGIAADVLAVGVDTADTAATIFARNSQTITRTAGLSTTGLVGMADDVSKFAKVSKFAGPVGYVAATVSSGMQALAGDKTGDGHRSADAIGGLAGGLAGGAVGAKGGAAIGGAIGAVFGGVGAVPGAFFGGIVGGIGGAIFGAMGGSKIVEKAGLGDYFQSNHDKKLKNALASLNAQGSWTLALDKNKDGTIDQSELRTELNRIGLTNLDMLDANKDGQYTGKELSQAMNAARTQNSNQLKAALTGLNKNGTWHKSLDKDHSGTISQAELEREMRRLNIKDVKSLDSSGDGNITARELSNALNAARKAKADEGKPAQSGRGGRAVDAHRGSKPAAETAAPPATGRGGKRETNGGASTSMPAARHEEAGKMSRIFTEIAKDRKALDGLDVKELQTKIMNDKSFLSGFSKESLAQMIKDPKSIDRVADRLEERMKTEGQDFSKQIAELRELQERMAGKSIATVIPGAAAAPVGGRGTSHH